MPRPLKLLIAEDNELDAELCLRALRQARFEPDFIRVQSASRFVEALAAQDWDIVLSDYSMPQFDAMEALKLLRRATEDIPFIVVTGALDEETAVECITKGADNYILKENLARLAPAVSQALQMYEERRERRLLESELRHSQKMETIGQLASGVAHDFNNLLTVISAHIELLEGQFDKTVEVSRSLDALKNTVEQASGVTRSLLSFSQKIRSEKRSIDLCAAIRKTALLLQRTLPAAIRISLDLDERTPRVEADQIQLQQVALNLALNARDAMRSGGELSIRVEPASPAGSNGKPRWARLLVSDTGEGIPLDLQERIFEPFFTTKPPEKGTGLGLAVIRRILDDHCGRISVESEPGKGTTFTIELPAIDSPKAGEEAPSLQPASRGRGGLVLVAEDDPRVRSILAGALSSLGYAVEEAGDGEELMQAFTRSEERVSLIILDVDLPVRDGVECLRRIRAAGSEAPAVMVAGRAEVSIDGEELGNTRLLPRPFRISDLASHLENPI